MSLVSIIDAYLNNGADKLLEGANLSIEENERICLVGRNGTGEYNPVTTNNTEVGKQRNRRTQIIITPKLDQFMDLIDKAPEEK